MCARFLFEPCPEPGGCDERAQNLCVPPYVPPCARDADCGQGFVCNVDLNCLALALPCGEDGVCPPDYTCRGLDLGDSCLTLDDGQVFCGPPYPERTCVPPHFEDWMDLGEDVVVERVAASEAVAVTQNESSPRVVRELGDEGCAMSRSSTGAPSEVRAATSPSAAWMLLTGFALGAFRTRAKSARQAAQRSRAT